MNQEKVYPGFKQAIMLFFVALAVAIILTIFVSIIKIFIKAPFEQHPLFIAVFTVVSLGLVILWGYKKTDAPFPEVFPFKPVDPALVGSYQLIDFTIKFEDATTIRSKDVESFSGTMNITSNNSGTQNVCVKLKGMANNCVKAVGWIEGEFFVGEFDSCEYKAPFTFKDGILTSTFPMGTCGANFSETDVWEKISSSASAIENAIENEQSAIGAVFGTIL